MSAAGVVEYNRFGLLGRRDSVGLTIEGVLRLGEIRSDGADMEILRARHVDLEKFRIRLDARIAAMGLFLWGGVTKR